VYLEMLRWVTPFKRKSTGSYPLSWHLPATAVAEGHCVETHELHLSARSSGTGYPKSRNETAVGPPSQLTVRTVDGTPTFDGIYHECRETGSGS